MNKKKLSIVVPVYYEEKGLEELYNRIYAVVTKLREKIEYEIIFINDGSTDGSWAEINKIAKKDNKVIGINLSRNFGHQIAITAGMDVANGDAVVIIDDDLQDPPEVILEMFDKWIDGYQVVYGLRKKRKKENIIKIYTSKMFYRILNLLSDCKIPNDVGDFRLMDRKVVDQLLKIREKNRYVRGLISWIGFKQCAVEYERDARFAGKSTYSLYKLFSFAFDGIISFSNKPLIVSSYIGLIVIICSIIYGAKLFIQKIINPDIVLEGWTSLMLAVVFFSGINLFTLGIIGQYISRIYTEVKNRPLYIIDEITRFK